MSNENTTMSGIDFLIVTELGLAELIIRRCSKEQIVFWTLEFSVKACKYIKISIFS